jgi:hypothetical protein
MALDEDLAENMRAALAGTGAVREVRMFGGLCFMLNGNMVAGTSKHGLLIRAGKDGRSDALARPGTKPMQNGGAADGGLHLRRSAPARGARVAGLARARRHFREYPVTKAPEVEAPTCKGQMKRLLLVFR